MRYIYVTCYYGMMEPIYQFVIFIIYVVAIGGMTQGNLHQF